MRRTPGLSVPAGPHPHDPGCLRPDLQEEGDWCSTRTSRLTTGSGLAGKVLGHQTRTTVLRLIGKWLGAGVIENGTCKDPGGSPRGHGIPLWRTSTSTTPDLWAEWWRRQHARGDMIIVRSPTTSSPVEHQETPGSPAGSPRAVARFALELHPGKTRLIESGGSPPRTGRSGAGKPETSILGSRTSAGRRGQDVSRSGGSPSRTDAGELKEVKDHSGSAGTSPSRSKGGGWERGTRPHGLHACPATSGPSGLRPGDPALRAPGEPQPRGYLTGTG